MSQTVPSVIRCCCVVSVESLVFWCLSRSVVLSTVGPRTCTVVDVRPSPAASSAVAPGVGRGACCFHPPVVPIVAPWACAPPSSAPALSSVFTILDGNRWCVDVSFPDGPPAAPGADLGVSGPPSGPSVSAGVHRPVFAFHHVVGFGALVLCVGGNGIIHSAHKAIQGDDCRPRRSSRLRFP